MITFEEGIFHSEMSHEDIDHPFLINSPFDVFDHSKQGIFDSHISQQSKIIIKWLKQIGLILYLSILLDPLQRLFYFLQTSTKILPLIKK
jgi:hypothetical protein